MTYAEKFERWLARGGRGYLLHASLITSVLQRCFRRNIWADVKKKTSSFIVIFIKLIIEMNVRVIL